MTALVIVARGKQVWQECIVPSACTFHLWSALKNVTTDKGTNPKWQGGKHGIPRNPLQDICQPE